MISQSYIIRVMTAYISTRVQNHGYVPPAVPSSVGTVTTMTVAGFATNTSQTVVLELTPHLMSVTVVSMLPTAPFPSSFTLPKRLTHNTWNGYILPDRELMFPLSSFKGLMT